ncbi:MAG: NADP-dependent phosphogluconate dehydrogenase [Anaerolineae bacterium]|jgi:6-phosphogluconate dehydrogenase|nr:NADP-dependent phosphogluconate dehydrogenase [Anaerolineae bacterium]MBT7072854.1 NADP-dependent phosphogluconate dehydrogenase [Anaerolineae bacterium]MBT7326315.1 NADP-dependent phosphogluconate dehydrogenase [Anaerolineae bacterium]
MKANFGFMGLGVMGHMLALNVERNGFHVAGYDLDEKKVAAFEQKYPEKNLLACSTLEEFLAALERPRRIMLMVPSGVTDAAINSIKDLLEPGDLLIDGGNTFFQDTERRSKELEDKGIVYIGTGVSGGEQGALWGPSIMPGGQDEAWALVKPIFEAISAKVEGEPCVTYIGPRGAGHYVKMVHNGIEYGDMQLIAEAYDILHRGLGLSNAELHEIFAEWNRGELESYLIEITADIFAKHDPESGQAVVDLILDEAAQKGTGKWTSQNALDLGAPTPTINAAVESRIVSAYKEERVDAAKVLNGPGPKISLDKKEVINWVRDALYTAKICSYAQGFALMRLASDEYNYDLDYDEIARIWRGGCIIRARFLNDIREAFKRNADLPNLMVDAEFAKELNARQSALRKVVALAAEKGIPALAFSASLAYYDAYRSARLPANLTQAQRDYFGAHTYRRVDKEGSFHTEWIDEN